MGLNANNILITRNMHPDSIYDPRNFNSQVEDNYARTVECMKEIYRVLELEYSNGGASTQNFSIYGINPIADRINENFYDVDIVIKSGKSLTDGIINLGKEQRILQLNKLINCYEERKSELISDINSNNLSLEDSSLTDGDKISIENDISNIYNQLEPINSNIQLARQYLADTSSWPESDVSTGSWGGVEFMNIPPENNYNFWDGWQAEFIINYNVLGQSIRNFEYALDLKNSISPGYDNEQSNQESLLSSMNNDYLGSLKSIRENVNNAISRIGIILFQLPEDISYVISELSNIEQNNTDSLIDFGSSIFHQFNDELISGYKYDIAISMAGDMFKSGDLVIDNPLLGFNKEEYEKWYDETGSKIIDGTYVSDIPAGYLIGDTTTSGNVSGSNDNSVVIASAAVGGVVASGATSSGLILPKIQEISLKTDESSNNLADDKDEVTTDDTDYKNNDTTDSKDESTDINKNDNNLDINDDTSEDSNQDNSSSDNQTPTITPSETVSPTVNQGSSNSNKASSGNSTSNNSSENSEYIEILTDDEPTNTDSTLEGDVFEDGQSEKPSLTDKIVKPDFNSSTDESGSGIGTALAIGAGVGALGGVAYVGAKHVKNKKEHDLYEEEYVEEEESVEEDDGSEILFNKNHLNLNEEINLDI